MLKEIAAKHYNDGRNCAEALLMAANEQYNLGLTDENIHHGPGRVRLKFLVLKL